MKALALAVLMSFSFAAQANISVGSNDELISKSRKGGHHVEPAPKDRDERKGGEEQPDSREETYEGNDRGHGGSFDGGGYEGDGGGMAGELFRVKGLKFEPKTNTLKTEDRGDVIVYTSSESQDISADETCTVITKTVVDKATNKVLSTDTDEFCTIWPL